MKSKKEMEEDIVKIASDKINLVLKYNYNKPKKVY